MHNAVVFNIRGLSWRLRDHASLEIATTEPANLASADQNPRRDATFG